MTSKTLYIIDAICKQKKKKLSALNKICLKLGKYFCPDYIVIYNLTKNCHKTISH